MVYVPALEILLVKVIIYLLQESRIFAFNQDEVSTKIPSEYANYTNVFSFNLGIELPKNTSINIYVIKLQDGKQSSYRLIYSLEPMELEILKTYIKMHLKTRFIQTSKSLASILILFNKKLDNSFCLCINY